MFRIIGKLSENTKFKHTTCRLPCLFLNNIEKRLNFHDMVPLLNGHYFYNRNKIINFFPLPFHLNVVENHSETS